MGSSPELGLHTKDPTNSGTPGVPDGTPGVPGLPDCPAGVPGVPNGFLVNIHHFRKRMNDWGHLQTLLAALTALSALHLPAGFSRRRSLTSITSRAEAI